MPTSKTPRRQLEDYALILENTDKLLMGTKTTAHVIRLILKLVEDSHERTD